MLFLLLVFLILRQLKLPYSPAEQAQLGSHQSSHLLSEPAELTHLLADPCGHMQRQQLLGQLLCLCPIVITWAGLQGLHQLPAQQQCLYPISVTCKHRCF